MICTKSSILPVNVTEKNSKSVDGVSNADNEQKGVQYLAHQGDGDANQGHEAEGGKQRLSAMGR
jgi:hypothetical protein